MADTFMFYASTNRGLPTQVSVLPFSNPLKEREREGDSERPNQSQTFDCGVCYCNMVERVARPGGESGLSIGPTMASICNLKVHRRLRSDFFFSSFFLRCRGLGYEARIH